MGSLSILKRGYARFLVGAVAGFCVLAVACFGSFLLQLDRPTAEGAQRCAIVGEKLRIAAEEPRSKIMLVGGSGVHQGLSADILSERLDKPVVNLGSFAGLSADQVLFNAREVAQPGDMVVLALEYKYYSGQAPSIVAVDYALSCGARYLENAPLKSRIEFILGAPVVRIFDAIKYHRRSAAQRAQARDTVRARISGRGDRLRDRSAFPAPDKALRERLALYQPMPIEIDLDSEDVRSITEFAKWARAKDICVVATWPNTIFFSAYAKMPAFSAIQKFYSEQGVQVIGTPGAAMFDQSLFYDTQYHMDIPGIERRTLAFYNELAATKFQDPTCKGRI